MQYLIRPTRKVLVFKIASPKVTRETAISYPFLAFQSVEF